MRSVLTLYYHVLNFRQKKYIRICVLAQLTRDESKKAMKHGEVKKIEASLLNKLTLGFQDLIMNFRKEESIFHGYFENN